MAVAAVPQNLVDELRSTLLEQLDKKGVDSVHPRDLDRFKSDDHWLRRFIAHNENNIETSLLMVWGTLKWRKDFQVNEINESNIKMDLIVKGIFFPHGKDVDGHPLLVFNGKLHSKSLTDNELKRCVVYWFERIERLTKGEQVSLFFDMEGCGLGNMDLELVKYLIGLFKDYYPYFLNYIIIFEMAWVLSAAFKLVKTWLPEKAIEKLKIVGKKDVQNFVPKQEALKSWGGDNDYVFSFVPEYKKKVDKPTNEPTTTRKVHFIDGSPMSEQVPVDSKDDGPVRVTPSSTITFLDQGNELVSTIELYNSDEHLQVAYKLKTTSPEKFKVKPSTGVLKPNGTGHVTVTLLPGFQLGGLSKDKFLVLSSPLDDKEEPNLDLIEFWKSTINRKVFQIRLRCLQSGDATTSRTNGTVTNHNPTPDNDKLTPIIKEIMEYQKQFRKDFRFIQLIGVALLLLGVVLGIVLMKVQQTKNDSHEYCRIPDIP